MAEIVAGAVVAGRYRLDARIDEGGAAQVWRAADQELQREVAVKILQTPAGSDASFVDAFRHEAQIEARLKHPNIVEVFDWGHDGDLNYIVMELLEGRTVRQISLSEGHHDPTLVLNVGRQAASALAYAHGEGIAHGTVGDHTIVVAPDGHATVIGFGLWCRGQCEQPPTPDADTYMLGEVLYEMLTGAAPFGPRPPSVPSDAPWPEHPHKLDSAIPQELDHIVMRAISPDPTQRYRTAGELEADLDALARPKSRAWLWWTLAILAVLVAIGATFLILSLQSPVVPDVVGKTQAEAAASLTSAGLKMVVTGQAPSSVVPAGLIVSEQPKAGTKVRRNTQVGVVVSAGKPVVAVPSVTGTTLDAASTAISGAGLVVGNVTKQNNNTFPVNTVISQTPAGGQDATQGSTVDLVVSAGQSTVTIPDVRGSSQSNATNQLTALGLKVSVGQAFSSQPVGTVITQAPAPATVVAVGSTVTINVSKGAAPVTVPNVVNATQDSATTTLQQLGLVVASTTATSSSIPVGNVIRQNPAAGAQVASGSKVTITVARKQ